MIFVDMSGLLYSSLEDSVESWSLTPRSDPSQDGNRC